MRDKIHQKLEIGDLVCFNPPYYKGLVIGKIEKFTPKGITCTYEKTMKCTRPFNEVIKIDEQYKKSQLENPEFFI